MLESIRSRSSGIFAWAIALLIIAAMALFGLGNYATDTTDPALYKDGDSLITLRQYQSALQQSQRRALAQNQLVDISSIEFKRLVMEQLISQTIVDSIAQDAGYIAADESVARLIVNNSAFQVDGKFDQVTYDDFIASNFGTKEAYEEILKQNLVSSQVSSGIFDSGLIIKSQEQELLNLLAEKRSIDLVSIKLVDIEPLITVTDGQIAIYFEENKDSYLDQEKVSVEYIALNAKTFEKGIEITDAELEQVYQESIDSFTEPEARQVRHILFTGSDAETKANEVLAKIKAGESFTELAKQSEDTGSAENGGDLGEITRGQMVEEFEQVAYELQLNTVSDPVSTEFGYHLIEVTAISGGEVKSFDDVKEQLRADQVTSRAEDEFFNKVDILRNATFENEDTLQVAAEELELFVEKSELFTRHSGEGYFNNPAIRNTAFSEQVLTENRNSDVIEVTPTEFVVIRKLAYQPEQPKKLEEVKENVTNALKNELAYERTKGKIERAFDKILESDDWEANITGLEAPAKAIQVSYLDSPSQLPIDVLKEIFSSSVDAGFDNSIGKAFDEGGNAFLFKLNSVDFQETESIDKSIVDNISNVMSFRSSASVSQNYIREKTREAMTKVDESLL